MTKLHSVPKSDAKRLREIIWENLPALGERYFAILLNKPESGYIPQEKVHLITSAFEQILARMPLENTDVRAEKAADIIELVKTGKVSIPEAKELMSIISMKFEIEELSMLRDKLNEATASASSRA